jgi:hypothetical protein
VILADGLAILGSDPTLARVHRLIASRAAPVVCIQIASARSLRGSLAHLSSQASARGTRGAWRLHITGHAC